MGVKFTSTFDAARTQRQVEYAIEKALSDALEEAVRVIQFFIATRGTPKSGKSGRVVTGKMLDSVFSEMDESGGTFHGGVGWKDHELYFSLQEDGFRHLGGDMVPAMNAFMDAYPVFREDLIRRLSEELARVL